MGLIRLDEDDQGTMLRQATAAADAYRQLAGEPAP
jgi:hypothetical protein